MYLVVELTRAGGDEGLPESIYLDRVAVFDTELRAMDFASGEGAEAYGVIDLDRGEILKTAIWELGSEEV